MDSDTSEASNPCVSKPLLNTPTVTKSTSSGPTPACFKRLPETRDQSLDVGRLQLAEWRMRPADDAGTLT